MFVSTNRTPVNLVAIQAVAGAEAADFGEHLVLLGLQASELHILVAQGTQVTRDETADGAAGLRRPNPRRPVDIVWHRNR